MCGIWALFGYDHSVSSELHHALQIAHRGPDFFRIETIPHFNHSYLAFHRLSIMDDLTGQQPLRLYQLPHLHLVCNGEIYNYKLLQKQYGFEYTTGMDGEVILHLYHKFGIKKALQLLDGVFAVAIFDTSNGTFHIGRDTFGVRPLFTIQQDTGELGISSEVKGLIGLISDNNVDTKIHPFKPATYASFNISHETGLTKLIDEGSYTDVDTMPLFKHEVAITDDVKENIRNLFTNAVGKRLMAERRIGCMLSGGLDSSLVAAIVVKLAREQSFKYPIQTFSIGQQGSPDLAKAKIVADMLGTEHHEVIFTAEEAFALLENVVTAIEIYDISVSRGSIPLYILAKYIRENTDTAVVFSGEGADELAQGYIYFHKAPSAEEAHEDSKRLLRNLYLYDNVRADRCVAAHGLELRVPFQDKAFCSYYLSIPKEMVQPQNGIEKYLLRWAFDGQLKGLLPDEILWRPKEGLSDGVSAKEDSWYCQLERYAQTKFKEVELDEAINLYPVNTPKTFEALLFRRIFESKFPGHCHLTPYIWMPKWMGEGITNPSQRVLENYKQ